MVQGQLDGHRLFDRLWSGLACGGATCRRGGTARMVRPTLCSLPAASRIGVATIFAPSPNLSDSNLDGN